MTKEFAGTIYVTVGIFISSVFSYLLQYYLGRTLSISDFGNFNALLSISYILGVPAGVLSTSLIKTVADLNAKQEYALLTRIFFRFSQLAIIIGAGVFLIITILSPIIATTLRIDSIYTVVAFGLLMSTTLLIAIPQAYLQGVLRYKAFAFYSVVGGFLRFVLPAVLILIGLGAKGAFIGIFLTMVANYFIAWALLNKSMVHVQNISARHLIKGIGDFAVPVFIINLCMMLVNNVDLILVKAFFDPNMAGYYAGTVTLGKILLFGAGTVTIIMFPKIATLHARKEDITKMFKFFFVIQLGIVLVALCGFIALPNLITLTFFGDKFTDSIKYVPLFSIFTGLYVLINFMVMFFLAIGRTSIYWLLLPVLVLQVVLILLFHQDLFSVIYANLVACVVGLVLLLGYGFRVLMKTLVL